MRHAPGPLPANSTYPVEGKGKKWQLATSREQPGVLGTAAAKEWREGKIQTGELLHKRPLRRLGNVEILRTEW